jgi:hypothetical protein
MTPERIAKAELFGADLHRLTNDIEMQNTEKNRAAAASFAIAQEHHSAIIFLLKNTFYSSAFTLLRSVFEAYLRGLWLKHCATDEQVYDFFRGKKPPDTMVSEIESKEAFTGGVLSLIKKENWTTMCAFTHTSGEHLQRWQSKNGVEQSFMQQELEECLNCAELIGAMAGLALVQLSQSGANGANVLMLMEKRWPRGV